MELSAIQLLQHLEQPPDGLDGRRSPPVPYHNFILQAKSEREFGGEQYTLLTRALIDRRICAENWTSFSSVEVCCVTKSVRLLARSPRLREMLCCAAVLERIAETLKRYGEVYAAAGTGATAKGILIEGCSIIEKLFTNTATHPIAVQLGVHTTLALLLSVGEQMVVRTSLVAFRRLAKSVSLYPEICCLPASRMLLQIVNEDYHREIQKLAVDVLVRFSQNEASRQQIRLLDGVRCIVTLLTRCSSNPEMATKLADLLTCIAYDADGRAEIRRTGGVQVLLVRLTEPAQRPGSASTQTPDSLSSPSPVSLSHARSTSDLPSPVLIETEIDSTICTMQSRICTTLTWLSMTDMNASLIREDNGVYHIAMLLLPARVTGAPPGSTPPPAKVELQRHAFRALRFLFSLERNRRLFKRLFTAELFDLFLRVEHYKIDLRLYYTMVNFVNAMTRQDLNALTACIHETNVNREPQRWIGEFGVLETLGQGAFGVVHKVQRRGNKELRYALKEIQTKNASVFGTTANKQAQSMQSILNEVQILQSLNHPNVVHYYDAMEASDRVYLLMQLVEGATLAEVVESESEKKKKFTEDRLWKISIQLCTALRYLHKDAKVVHRDLKPGNIMVDWGDHVTVTDFGLAKQKESETSMMQSSVGTMQYSCPEVIQNHEYDSRADIWSFGCILYQIAVLSAPFESKSMLALAKKIVEGKYAPIAGYSKLVTQVVSRCLSVDVETRPDINGVTRLIAPLLVKEIDRLQSVTVDSSTELQAERSRRRQHQSEAEQHKLTIHSLVRSQSVTLDASSVSCGLQSPTFALGPPEGDGFMSPTRKLEASFQSLASEDPWLQSSESVPSVPATVTTLPASSDGRERQHRRRGSVEGLPSAVAGTPSDPLDNEVAAFATPSPRPPRSGSSRSSRPPSGSSKMVRIGPGRVRSVDPITNMLNQLHKVVYISQLPAVFPVRPEEQIVFERNRHYIDRYKRELFTQRGQASSLKFELKQLSGGSADTIAAEIGAVPEKKEWNSLFDPGAAAAADVPEHTPDAAPRKMTYVRLQQLIEETLQMSGYYESGERKGGGSVLTRMDSSGGGVGGGGGGHTAHPAPLSPRPPSTSSMNRSK